MRTLPPLPPPPRSGGPPGGRNGGGLGLGSRRSLFSYQGTPRQPGADSRPGTSPRRPETSPPCPESFPGRPKSLPRRPEGSPAVGKPSLAAGKGSLAAGKLVRSPGRFSRRPRTFPGAAATFPGGCEPFPGAGKPFPVARKGFPLARRPYLPQGKVLCGACGSRSRRSGTIEAISRESRGQNVDFLHIQVASPGEPSRIWTFWSLTPAPRRGMMRTLRGAAGCGEKISEKTRAASFVSACVS